MVQWKAVKQDFQVASKFFFNKDQIIKILPF